MNFDDFVSEEEINSIDLDADSLVDRQFDKCRFISCTFRDTDLRSTIFESCSFVRCDFVLPKVEGLKLRTVTFQDCRLIGIPFGECNQFGFNPDFHGCIIDSCMFLRIELKKKELSNNTFRNSDFIECDLREASFGGCRFDNARFQNCDLRQADFREAGNYIINPDENRVKGSKHRIPGALSFLSFTGIDLEP